MSDELTLLIEKEQEKKTKKVTEQQLQSLADEFDIPLASLKAVIEVECRGNGFTSTGEPTILFEPHVFYDRLTKNGKIEIRNQVRKEQPLLCYPKWRKDNYGSYSSQHKKLQKAVKYHRTSALESCSWRLGQVMGYHWKTLGYSSLQEFINLVYKDEYSQLQVMMRYLVKNNLLDYMKSQNWDKFALGYNGKGYKANQYHVKLREAYQSNLA